MRFIPLLLTLFASAYAGELVITKDQKNDRAIYFFSVKDSPFQSGDKIHFYQKNLLGSVVSLFELKVIDGEIMAITGNKKIEPLSDVQFSATTLPGEPFEYMIKTADGKKKVYKKYIHSPIETEFSTGEKLSIEIISPTIERFSLQGTGFKPNEELTLTDNNKISKIHANDKGEFIYILLPATKGNKNGQAKVIIENSAKESKTLNYNWGYPSK